MKAEIITIGDEILIGQTINTNSAWIGAELSKSGFDVRRIVSIHDNRNDIMNILTEVSGKLDLVIITGGLGPTSDDITKSTLCDFFNTKQVLDQGVLHMIEEMIMKRNFQMNENNIKQAFVPESCRVLKNSTGTAPGMWFEKDDTIFISLPGVPYEMKYLMNEYVLPEIKVRFNTQNIFHRTIMTYGEPEARLAELLEGFESRLPVFIRLAYLPSSGVIKLRLTGTGTDMQILTSQVEGEIKNLYNIIPDLIFSDREESIESVIGSVLTETHKTISTAESCTGGRIAAMITGIPGSSGYFKGSVVAYDNFVKKEILGVEEELISKFGAVSEQVVIKMAENIRNKFKTDFAVSTSGIAGPDGGTPEKPVGTVWIAVASEKETVTKKHVFGNYRNINIERFSIAALDLLRRQIIKQ